MRNFLLPQYIFRISNFFRFTFLLCLKLVTQNTISQITGYMEVNFSLKLFSFKQLNIHWIRKLIQNLENNVVDIQEIQIQTFFSVPGEWPKFPGFVFSLGFLTTVQDLIPLRSEGAIVSSTEKISYSLLFLEPLSLLNPFSPTILSHIMLLLHHIFFKKKNNLCFWLGFVDWRRP